MRDYLGLNLIFDLDGCLIDSKEVQKMAFFGSYQEIVGDDQCPSFEKNGVTSSNGSSVSSNK